MPSVRRSAILSGNQAVAQIAEGPVFFLDEQLPDLIVICTYDTGGFVDWSSADAHPHLYIARYESEVHLADITGVGTNVVEAKGEQRFSFTWVTSDYTESDQWDNVTNPLTVDMAVASYPEVGVGGRIPLVVGDVIHIDAEYLQVTTIVSDNVTFTRGMFGSTIAAHPDGALLHLSDNPFTTPGNYIAQVIGTFGGKTQRTQRFLIEVLDSVPAP